MYKDKKLKKFMRAITFFFWMLPWNVLCVWSHLVVEKMFCNTLHFFIHEIETIHGSQSSNLKHF